MPLAQAYPERRWGQKQASLARWTWWREEWGAMAHHAGTGEELKSENPMQFGTKSKDESNYIKYRQN
jgi:hypothetical protein